MLQLFGQAKSEFGLDKIEKLRQKENELIVGSVSFAPNFIFKTYVSPYLLTICSHIRFYFHSYKLYAFFFLACLFERWN